MFNQSDENVVRHTRAVCEVRVAHNNDVSWMWRWGGGKSKVTGWRNSL